MNVHRSAPLDPYTYVLCFCQLLPFCIVIGSLFSTGGVYPSAALPRSTSGMSGTGVTQPPAVAVTGTTSTLTDSVFLSGSGSSRKYFSHKENRVHSQSQTLSQ